MTARAPKFSAFPYERLRVLTRREAELESLMARWIAARPLGARVAALLGDRACVRVVGAGPRSRDPHAAVAEVRIAGASIEVTAASRPIRAITQRLLGGPDELAAPRPLTLAEHAIWALVIAAAIEDTGLPAEVWPLPAPLASDGTVLELAVDFAGTRMTVTVTCPPAIALVPPPPRPLPARPLELPIVAGRCALTRAALATLAARDVIVVDRACELVVGDGAIGLAPACVAPQAVEAAVATGYVRRDMALPDEAHVELTVQLGTTRLSLRQLAELAVGQIISLDRPLGGSFELRAEGRVVGQGELVAIEGELGVRVVSLAL